MISNVAKLKFNHGVEIGASWAYLGHYLRTRDINILKIHHEENDHRSKLDCILFEMGERPNKYIDRFFTFIGKSIYYMCRYSPTFTLDIVASIMEKFAVFSYKSLSKTMPQHKQLFLEMAETEQKHDDFFNGKIYEI